MYNRYIPSDNGTYRRKSVPEPRTSSSVPCPAEPPPTTAPAAMAGGLLKRLAPGWLDTGDLLTILILLLLMQDGNEDADTILLALAAFLIL